MKNAAQMADVMDRFAAAIGQFAEELRDQDGGDADFGAEVDGDQDQDHDVDQRAAAPRQGNGPAEDAVLQVKAGDLWRLVNRSRKMIRLARQGKVPSMESRAPLCRSIKVLKQQGLVRKPFNLRDRD